MEATDEYKAMTRQLIHGIGCSLGIPAIMPGEYRNPFHFLDEFDDWFEFEKRKHSDNEPTHRIIADMLSHDLALAAKSFDANYTSLKRYANEHFGKAVFDNRTAMIVSSS